ncbi:adenosylcobinamide-phosphate synthase, partial [Candidatus Aerophobetes bacterium]
MRLLAIVLAYLLDLILGDPYYLPHPVRGMGRLIEYLERKLRNTSVLAGMILAIAVVGLVYLGSFFAIRFADNVNAWAGFAISTVLIFSTLSTRSLD